MTSTKSHPKFQSFLNVPSIHQHHAVLDKFPSPCISCFGAYICILQDLLLKWPAVILKFQSSYSKRLFNRKHHFPLSFLKDLVLTSRSRQPRFHVILLHITFFTVCIPKKNYFWHCSSPEKKKK